MSHPSSGAVTNVRSRWVRARPAWIPRLLRLAGAWRPRRSSRLRALAALAAPLAAALLAAACPRAAAAPRPRNVLFILVDTLRADHLPVYGYGRDTSPNLTALARGSIVFTNNRSQASCTFPSVNSMLTGRSPSAFLGQPGGAMGVPAGISGLAEILRARGFHTVAISASPIVRKNPTRFNPGGGYDRGFERFDEECLWRKADCVTARAREHLKRGGRPLLLYLHYLDPHGPYALPAWHRLRFARGRPEKEFIRRGDPNPIANWLYKGAPDPGVTRADLAYLADLYDDDIAFFDAQLARLLADLAAGGLAGDTIVAFSSDHGEEFLEHGHVKHCHTLFDSSIRTPLVLRIPGVRPVEVAAPVENLDIVPTLLDYLGVAAPAAPAGSLEGRSLRPQIDGRAAGVGNGPRYQRSAQGALRSICDGRYKLIHDLAAGCYRLYDLSADPGETRDVLAANRLAFFRLRDALGAWLAATEGAGAGEALRRSSEAEKRLRSVGYLD